MLKSSEKYATKWTTPYVVITSTVSSNVTEWAHTIMKLVLMLTVILSI